MKLSLLVDLAGVLGFVISVCTIIYSAWEKRTAIEIADSSLFALDVLTKGQIILRCTLCNLSSADVSITRTGLVIKDCFSAFAEIDEKSCFCLKDDSQKGDIRSTPFPIHLPPKAAVRCNFIFFVETHAENGLESDYSTSAKVPDLHFELVTNIQSTSLKKVYPHGVPELPICMKIYTTRKSTECFDVPTIVSCKELLNDARRLLN